MGEQAVGTINSGVTPETAAGPPAGGKRRRGRPPGGGPPRVLVITLKGTSELREWLAAASRDTQIPAATIVRSGLAAWARETRRRRPPEK